MHELLQVCLVRQLPLLPAFLSLLVKEKDCQVEGREQQDSPKERVIPKQVEFLRQISRLGFVEHSVRWQKQS